MINNKHDNDYISKETEITVIMIVLKNNKHDNDNISKETEITVIMIILITNENFHQFCAFFIFYVSVSTFSDFHFKKRRKKRMSVIAFSDFDQSCTEFIFLECECIQH